MLVDATKISICHILPENAFRRTQTHTPETKKQGTGLQTPRSKQHHRPISYAVARSLTRKMLTDLPLVNEWTVEVYGGGPTIAKATNNCMNVSIPANLRFGHTA